MKFKGLTYIYMCFTATPYFKSKTNSINKANQDVDAKIVLFFLNKNSKFN